MLKEKEIHENYKDEIIFFLNNLGFNCIDFEKQEKGTEKKKPDIKELNNNILIEVKVLFLNNILKKQANEIGKKLVRGEAATYWLTNTPNFHDHLQDCRYKFRQYDENKTMVIFINKMAHQEQSLEDLLSGEEYYIISSDDQNISIDGSGHKNREIRANINHEIGAIGQYYPNEKYLKIIHNTFASQCRKIPTNVFANFEKIKQKNYTYKDNINIFENIKNYE